MTALGGAYTAQHGILEQRKADMQRLRTVIFDKGPHPEVHDAIVAKHRSEWPALWIILDELVGRP